MHTNEKISAAPRRKWFGEGSVFRKFIKYFYYTSILCGILPLLSGIVILFFWWLHGSEFWLSAGFFNMAIGTLVVFSGFILLWVYVSFERIFKRMPLRRLLKRALLCLVLLLANFPVAGICVGIAFMIGGKFDITVKNETDSTVESFVVLMGEMREDFGSIPPKEEKIFSIRIKNYVIVIDDSHEIEDSERVDFSATVAGKKVRRIIGLGKRWDVPSEVSVTFKPDGNIKIVPEPIIYDKD